MRIGLYMDYSDTILHKSRIRKLIVFTFGVAAQLLRIFFSIECDTRISLKNVPKNPDAN